MLPENYMPGAPSFTPLVAGIEIAKVNVSSLNRLRRYGAVRPHCRNGGLLVQTDVINNGEVVMSVPWRTGSGKASDGMLASHAVESVEPSIIVQGAGDTVRAISAGFSRLLSAPLVELWNVYFLRLFKEAVNDVGNGVLPS
ncbi:hypothetical protein HPB49_011547 [Dermacentor silvarum]|uniref:Uncharacterized protein n=1 Tax=Dermacentor silvarum TaxID=543639 RepID=A0ACB8CES0_DERSI|nr:hypothetical protein HPB49_011547 [Dermacentor silvarum]